MLLRTKFYLTDGQNTRKQLTRGRKSKRASSKSVLYIPIILSGSPNECWPYTCDACVIINTNQRLRSAGDNDQRSKRFGSNDVLCASFTRQTVKTRMIRLQVIEGPDALDQIAFCAFHSFLVEVQTHAGYMHATHA